MARIRSIKPEFFTHPEVVACSLPARLLLLSLLTQADDEGRLYDQPTRIRGEAFGENDKVNVARLLEELQVRTRIRRYEADGRPCIQIVNFSAHQRVSHPSPSRIPPESLGSVSRKSPERLRPSRAPAEQGTELEALDSSSMGSSKPYPADQEPPSENGQTPVEDGPVVLEALGSLTPDQRHLLRRVARTEPAFASISAGQIERIRTDIGNRWLTETLRVLADSPPTSEVASAGAYLDAVVERVTSGPDYRAWQERQSPAAVEAGQEPAGGGQHGEGG